jgi:aromatic-L-amino-acid decarboxylase
VFALTPEYLRGDSAREAGTIDYMDYSLQLGRRFRALKAWMTLRAFGRAGIASRIREHCRLAALLASWIGETPDWQLAAPQSMGVVCFRYAPPTLGDDACDRVNEQIVERVCASGAAYVTQTVLRGRVCIRVGIGNVLTTEEHVRGVWALLSS